MNSVNKTNFYWNTLLLLTQDATPEFLQKFTPFIHWLHVQTVGHCQPHSGHYYFALWGLKHNYLFFFKIFILHIKFWGIREYPHSPSCHQTWCAVCQRNYLWIECKMCGFTSGFQKGTLTTWTDNLSVTDVTDVCIYNVQCIYVTGHAVNSFFSADSICKRYYQIIELIFCHFIFNS